MNRFHAVSARPGRTSAVCDYFNPGAGYGAKATTATKCSNDEEVVEAICAQVEGHDLVFGRLMELSNVQGCGQDNDTTPCTR